MKIAQQKRVQGRALTWRLIDVHKQCGAEGGTEGGGEAESSAQRRGEIDEERKKLESLLSVLKAHAESDTHLHSGMTPSELFHAASSQLLRANAARVACVEKDVAKRARQMIDELKTMLGDVD